MDNLPQRVLDRQCHWIEVAAGDVLEVVSAVLEQLGYLALAILGQSEVLVARTVSMDNQAVELPQTVLGR
ncbi:Hypothetical protein NTJ_14207 [Nesidiocoris tenuis]|uniref:Uncharacterized protein n=1 Tax=Nesidiocoris tenuis TaxID=355587 RepID=A0ABN7BC21_9HEMI|nr:Hypothetical protein NTJ_14207 [Nesidiocoris tenuis]